MSTLRTDYKDDVFTGSRKYRMIDNGDGTVSFEDATTYTQTGDTYGAAEINEVNSRLNGLDGSVYKAEDGAETAISDNDYFPFYDTSANASKKSLWSNIKTVLQNTFAIKAHDSNSASTYGAGTNTQYGHVKLSDNYTDGTSQANSSVGASEYAVTSSYVNLWKAMDSHGRAPGSPATSVTKHFYFDYKNGKYGWNESSSRPTGTFHPFSSGAATITEFSQSGNSTYTAPDSGKLYIYLVAEIDETNWYGNGDDPPANYRTTTVTVSRNGVSVASCNATIEDSNRGHYHAFNSSILSNPIDVNKNDEFTITIGYGSWGGGDAGRAVFFLV